MTKKKRVKKFIDVHTENAITVAGNDYFIISKTSDNENPGLLVGTAVRKTGEPEPKESKYYNRGQLYWTVNVLCPNNEIRKVCCDALTPCKTNQYFLLQQEIFEETVEKTFGLSKPDNVIELFA